MSAKEPLFVRLKIYDKFSLLPNNIFEGVCRSIPLKACKPLKEVGENGWLDLCTFERSSGKFNIIYCIIRCAKNRMGIRLFLRIRLGYRFNKIDKCLYSTN